MVKNKVGKALRSIVPVALVIIGWCCFLGGNIIHAPIQAKIALLAAARALP
jgi:hypothetical protein